MPYYFFTYQFPDCSDDKAISVACLDLHYYVSVDVGAQKKREKNDISSPLTLSGLEPEVEEGGNGSMEPCEKPSKCLSSLNFSSLYVYLTPQLCNHHFFYFFSYYRAKCC